MQRTGASALLDALEHHGVRAVFGLPGTQVVDLWEALRRRPSIRPVVATNELAASFMANGAARASGRVAALLTIPGPGFTYALSGIAEARLDSVPLLFVVPAPAVRDDGGRAQQSIDHAAVAAPLVKGVVRATDASGVGAAAREAIELSEAGEPGPVLLELPVRALGARAGVDGSHPSASPTSPDPGAVSMLESRLRASRRPLLLAGQGALGAGADLRVLAERLEAPVLTTTSGRGVIPEDHPLSVTFDTPGAPVTTINELVGSADLVLALGCALSHNGSLGLGLRLPPERLVRIDASTDAVAAGYPCSLAIVADCGAVLGMLDGAGGGGGWEDDELARWRVRLDGLASSLPEPSLAGRPPAALFAALRDAVPDETPIVTDSGHHQYLARRHLTVRRPRTLLVPADFQSMGYGIAGAIGAAVATGGPAVAVVGDGGLNIGAMELLTASREGLDLLVIVLVDHAFGLIRLQQLSRVGHESGVAIPVPDLAKLADSLGIAHVRVEDDPQALLAHAFQRGGVTLVEVDCDAGPGLDRARRQGRAVSAVSTVLGQDAVGRLKAVARRRRS